MVPSCPHLALPCIQILSEKEIDNKNLVFSIPQVKSFYITMTNLNMKTHLTSGKLRLVSTLHPFHTKKNL